MATSHHSAELAATMPAVARNLLGEPNKALSRGQDWRYGKQGSLSVDADKGTWFSHEEGVGGGVLDLIQRERGGSVADALGWMEAEGLRDCGAEAAPRRAASPTPPQLRSSITPPGTAIRLRDGQRVVATFDYRKDGVLLYRKHRIEPGIGKSKDFQIESPNGAGGWNGHARGIERIPYRYDDLTAAPADDIVFLVEGEKQADLLTTWGFTATSLKDWRDEWGGIIGDRQVVILPDNDTAGRDQASRAAAKLPGAVIMALPDLPEAGDVMDWPGGAEDLLSMAREAIAKAKPRTSAPANPFAFIDVADWQGMPVAPRRWLLDGWLPLGEAALLTGAGAMGKSLIAQQLATCIAAGRSFMGVEVEQCTSIYITCEDSDDDPNNELLRRQSSICESMGIRLDSLRGRLMVRSWKRCGMNELCAPDEHGTLQPTQRFVELRATALAMGVRFIVLDNASHMLGGDENKKRDVAAFAGMLNGLAEEIGGVVLLLHHPNKAGVLDGGDTSGNQFGGSVGWENHVRSRMFLSAIEGDDDARQMTNPKANYGPRNGGRLTFRWHNGAFVNDEDIPEDQRAELARNVTASAENAAFLACLKARADQGEDRGVGPNPGPNYAPTQFEKMPLAKGYNRTALAKAMERLFAIKAIETYTYENKAKGRSATLIREVK